jgi:outer membrane receptor for ferrienterochelin and colicin
MKNRYVILLSLLFYLTVPVYSQTTELKGNIKNEAGEPLIGATVVWKDTNIGAITDEKGNFKIAKMNKEAFLLIQYVGYDVVSVGVLPVENEIEIIIEGVVQLQTINVTGQNRDNFTSTLTTNNLESISSCELKKAACCSLAESFETNAAVDVMQQDAVTSTTEIQMLGLRGIYTQLLMEKRPMFTGLGSPLALEYIPGTWVSDIQISKGASTVQNGYQAIAGQINIELVKPNTDKPFFLNLFGSTKERGEINVHLNKNWNHDLSSGLLLHGSVNLGEFDRNEDTFMDAPTKKNLDGVFRTFYYGDLMSAQINVQALMDEREGGQIIPDEATNVTDYYRIHQKNQRLDVFGKVGFLGFKNVNSSMGLIYNVSWHKTRNIFGRRTYNGDQKNLYANLIYASTLPNEKHSLNFGASYQYDDFREFLDEANYSRMESVAGAFGEYVFGSKNAGGDHLWDKLGLIAGLRIDHHGDFGWLLTPRFNIKYNFSDHSVMRMSVGRGLRTAQVLSENFAVLASNRIIRVANDLKMEDAWNIGFNYTQNFKVGDRPGSFVVDAYRTVFVNQIVMDMESQQNRALFYNLDGRSYSNSLLFLTSFKLSENLGVKVAYKLNDVRITYDGELKERPMNARNRALLTADYETRSKKWMFNMNTQYTGKQRFAAAEHLTTYVPGLENFEGYAPAYVMVNAQITRKFKNLEFYLGGENLTNTTQKHAILDWQNPFGEFFDAMQVWGPLLGIRGYAGLRYWID